MPPDINRMAEDHRDEIVALASELIRIETTNTGVMPTGNETAAAECLRRRFAAERITAEIAGRVPERGNVFAGLPGASGRTALLLASHTDVVPAGDPAQWTHPPFAAAVQDGYLHGRGAADMKGTVAAQAMALILLRRMNVPLAHGVGFVSAADEEAGGAYGMGWVALAHPERLRARYCVNEGGGTFLRIDGSAWCLLGVGEKGRFEVHATFHGRGAHAAQPWYGENALFQAEQALGRLRAYRPELDTDSPIFPHLRRVLGAVTPATVDEVIDRVAEGNPRLAGHIRQVSRMLITPTMIAGGVKSNSVPDTCRLTCDVRALPHQDHEYVAAQVRGLLPGAEVQIDQTAVANASPADPAWVAVLSDVLSEALGQRAEVTPTITGGFTDSRFVRALGVPAYGFAPLHPDSDSSRRRIHGPNESVSIQDLVLETAFYLGLASRLASA